MKGLLAALSCLAATPALARDLDLDALAGVYKYRFENGLVSGEKFTSENVMEIVKVAPDRAYLRLALQFYNHHTCSFTAIARVEGDTLVHRSTGRSGDGCELGLRDHDGTLILEDKDGRCRAYGCGVRGTFDGISFSRASRRDIRYMARLKASDEFKEAMDEDSRPAR